MSLASSRFDDPVSRLSAVDTSDLPSDGRPRYNRLIFEKSPYLLQHAENPVDWSAWDEAALDRARKENRPIFLSIGYSTCHWCHVMAHESFEDPAVAEILNRDFVAIKVDREERPDIDATYMTACQMLTGSGGWPLTVVLTPEKEPFFAATYLPKRTRGGMSGLIEVLERISEVWRTAPDRLTVPSRQLTEALQSRLAGFSTGSTLDESPLRKALEEYRVTFDPKHAGFGSAPKFPAPHNLSLLMRLGQRFGDPEATGMALQTLRALRSGGIYDQVGFGLHRYAVDHEWLVPHFEKMLYDQALLILAAVEAWQVSGERFFARLAEATCSYLVRELQSPEGGFYCGEDADSQGTEGAYYLWTPEEVEEVLGADRGEVFCRSFNITTAGNFEGRNIPHLGEDDAALAHQAGIATGSLATNLEEARQQLLAARSRRPRPHRDEKLLTGWNGLAIAALARTGWALSNPAWVEAAAAAAACINTRLRRPDGRLLRSWRGGAAVIPAFLEDYSCFVWGLLELHQARREATDLALAVTLTKAMERLFGDGSGGFYDTGVDAELVLTRGRSLQDGALPSGTSVAINILLRLGRLTGDAGLEERGRRLLEGSLAQINRYPSAYAQALCGLDFSLGPIDEVTLVPGRDGSAPAALEKVLRSGYYPRLVISATDSRKDGRWGEVPNPDRPSAGLCRDRACRPLVNDPEALQRLMASRL